MNFYSILQFFHFQSRKRLYKISLNLNYKIHKNVLKAYLKVPGQQQLIRNSKSKIDGENC